MPQLVWSPQLEFPFTLTDTCQSNLRNRKPLLETGWDQWLQNHPNPGLRNTPIEIICYAEFIGNTGPSQFIFGEDLPSALNDPTSITNEI